MSSKKIIKYIVLSIIVIAIASIGIVSGKNLLSSKDKDKNNEVDSQKK